MIRVVIENILLFLLPTLLYVLYMYIVRGDKRPASRSLDDAPLFILFFLGAALVVGTLIVFGSVNGGKPGQAYIPPHIENGKIVPGTIE
jgi:uncharacterized membrane protein YadS